MVAIKSLKMHTLLGCFFLAAFTSCSDELTKLSADQKLEYFETLNSIGDVHWSVDSYRAAKKNAKDGTIIPPLFSPPIVKPMLEATCDFSDTLPQKPTKDSSSDDDLIWIPTSDGALSLSGEKCPLRVSIQLTVTKTADLQFSIEQNLVFSLIGNELKEYTDIQELNLKRVIALRLTQGQKLESFSWAARGTAVSQKLGTIGIKGAMNLIIQNNVAKGDLELGLSFANYTGVLAFTGSGSLSEDSNSKPTLEGSLNGEPLDLEKDLEELNILSFLSLISSY